MRTIYPSQRFVQNALEVFQRAMRRIYLSRLAIRAWNAKSSILQTFFNTECPVAKLGR